MARWEIQQRFRSGRLANWLDDNAGEDALRLYKRGFFADWRALDRHKRARYDRMDYVLDTNGETPKMMTGAAFRRGETPRDDQGIREDVKMECDPRKEKNAMKVVSCVVVAMGACAVFAADVTTVSSRL